MYRPLVVFITIILWSTTTLPQPLQANAQTALNRAFVQSLRNLVQLMPQNRAAKRARVSDVLSPGDALSTGRTSLAELRFNDGSLARVGEQAIFRFVNKTRNFQLSNGTVLLLIPPGQGRTNVWTPNATAAIRGSALFLRYIPETATTVVGALTNSNIEVSNQQADQRQVLKAGQMVVLVKDRMEGLYNFDLKTFYQTSDLVQGLELNKKSGANSLDPAIAAVQAETSAALAAQLPLSDTGVIVNPSFVKRPDNNQTQQSTLNLQQDSQNPFNINSNSPAKLLENSEIISNPDNSQLPTKTETSIGVPPNNGTEQSTGGNNEIGGGVTGGGEINSGNVNGGGVTGGGEINSGNVNGGGVTGGGEINSGNVNGGGVTGGGEINSGNVNSNGNNGNNGNGNNGVGQGVGGGRENNRGNGNGNNGVGQGVGGGRENNRGNGNGNNGVGQGVGGGRENNRGNGNDDD